MSAAASAITPQLVGHRARKRTLGHTAIAGTSGALIVAIIYALSTLNANVSLRSSAATPAPAGDAEGSLPGASTSGVVMELADHEQRLRTLEANVTEVRTDVRWIRRYLEGARK